jgi:NAD(P)-dependent dehydrogenase (short-subunit alcohol dehydrogenase family)
MGSFASLLPIIYTQYYPPDPTITEANLPHLDGKVFVVTGATSGVGLELAKMLYAAGGTVYMMNRGDEAKSLKLIEDIKALKHGSSTVGALQYIPIDLADLSSVPSAVSAFTKSSSRLDVLFNNAGIASAPVGSKTAQGLDPHYGVNMAGPHLLTKLLLPALTYTAKIAPPDSVRVVWNGSLLVEMLAPKGGVRIDQLRNPTGGRHEHYAASRAGNFLLASEWDRRCCRAEGIVSVVQNPGNLQTNIWRTTSRLLYYPASIFLRKPEYGAYTNLWAAFYDGMTADDGGRYIMPNGRWHPGQRKDLLLALKSKDEGGTGQAAEAWDWCEEVGKPFLPK